MMRAVRKRPRVPRKRKRMRRVGGFQDTIHVKLHPRPTGVTGNGRCYIDGVLDGGAFAGRVDSDGRKGVARLIKPSAVVIRRRFADRIVGQNSKKEQAA